MLVNAQQVTETGPFSFVAEASDLGFPVGRIPRKLTFNVGPFEYRTLELIRHDEEGFTYKQWMGPLTLTVFND